MDKNETPHRSKLRGILFKICFIQIINQHAYIVSRYGPIKTYLKVDERESG